MFKNAHKKVEGRFKESDLKPWTGNQVPNSVLSNLFTWLGLDRQKTPLVLDSPTENVSGRMKSVHYRK